MQFCSVAQLHKWSVPGYSDKAYESVADCGSLALRPQ